MSTYWQPYRLVYQAKGPLHIGHYRLGYIQRTRYYIPGRAMWGAITANLTRSDYSYNQYEEVGQGVHSNIRFSYFFPALNSQEPLLPEFTSEGLRMGSMPVDQFEQSFIRAFGQTAIEPSVNAAEDESLHETEFICPAVRENGESKPVYFVGYLFLKKDAEIAGKKIAWNGENPLKFAVREISVGGERKYGFGRLVLDEKGSVPLDPQKDGKCRMFGHSLILSHQDHVEIEIEAGKPVPAHLKCKGCLDLKGDIEPLVGREWGTLVTKNPETKGKTEIGAGAGQRISEAQLCWVPGSIATKTLTHQKIGSHGILGAGGVPE